MGEDGRECSHSNREFEEVACLRFRRMQKVFRAFEHNDTYLHVLVHRDPSKTLPGNLSMKQRKGCSSYPFRVTTRMITCPPRPGWIQVGGWNKRIAMCALPGNIPLDNRHPSSLGAWKNRVLDITSINTSTIFVV